MADIYLKDTWVGPFFNGVLNTNIYKWNHIKQSTALPGMASSTPTVPPEMSKYIEWTYTYPYKPLFTCTLESQWSPYTTVSHKGEQQAKGLSFSWYWSCVHRPDTHLYSVRKRLPKKMFNMIATLMCAVDCELVFYKGATQTCPVL